MPKHPIQPVVKVSGIARFKENANEEAHKLLQKKGKK